MALEIQTHLLGEGRGSVEISRDGNHSYKVIILDHIKQPISLYATNQNRE